MQVVDNDGPQDSAEGTSSPNHADTDFKLQINEYYQHNYANLHHAGIISKKESSSPSPVTCTGLRLGQQPQIPHQDQEQYRILRVCLRPTY